MGALLWRRLDALWGVVGAQGMALCYVGSFGEVSIDREGTIEEIYI